jgi:hypothetical protein
MSTNQQGPPNPFNPFELPDLALNIVETACAIPARTVEIILYRWHGTRYFSMPIIFCANLLMIALPIFGAVTTGVISMIPLVHMPVPTGMFDVAAFAKLYFLLSIVHGIRIYRLMIDPSKERFSEWEGEPLPPFYLLPKGGNFWFRRILLEPIVVFLAAIFLQHAFIIQSGLATFLQFAAMCLAMKEFIGWYRSWLALRIYLDAANIAPLMAKLMENTATEADLAPIHIAKLPKDLPEDIRRNTAIHIAKAFTPEGNQA